jgi:formylglycine-generating enzyme required for sulfatase activity
MRSPPVHLRARLRAGRVLGRIGDPRLVLREKDGLRYILPEDWVPVPAGRYPIGSRAGDPQAYPDEQPPFEIDLDAFSIARRPVTNAEFACFVAAGGYEREELWEGERARAWLDGRSDLGAADFPGAVQIWQIVQTEEGKNRLRQSDLFSPDEKKYYTETVATMTQEDYLAILTRRLDAKSRRRPQYWDDSDWNGANLPVTGVTWFEARAYCAWLAEVSGGALRLPSEFEWEAAARGKEGRIYPWGPDWDENRANTIEGRVQRPTPVGLYAAADGIGPGGAEDQAGNVWEWTLSPYTQDYHQAPQTDRSNEESRFRVARGGSWYYDGWFARCACRGGNVPDGFFIDIGFRLLSPGPSVPAA